VDRLWVHLLPRQFYRILAERAIALRNQQTSFRNGRCVHKEESHVRWGNVENVGGSENGFAAQLAIWLAARIRKLRVLQQTAQTPEQRLHTPTSSGQEMPDPGSTSPSTDVLGRGSEAAEAPTVSRGAVDQMPPVIGWCINGHRWSTYIAWRNSRDTDAVVSYVLRFPPVRFLFVTEISSRRCEVLCHRSKSVQMISTASSNFSTFFY